jgi:uncharacterized membrane protein YcaP (DUF421 family)
MEPYTFDLQRIFLGDVPIAFALEIVFRTAFLFMFTLVMLRFVGQRGIGQLSLFEFAIIIALGSAVGDPMFYPDVPLLHGMIVITVIIVLQRILILLTIRNDPVQKFVEGSPCRLVADGRVDLEGKNRAKLSSEEIFMELRRSGAEQLGQIKRAYLEADGKVSVFLFSTDEVKSGLPLLPAWDLQIPIMHEGDTAAKSGDYACMHCGEIRQLGQNEKVTACLRCGEKEWLSVRTET